jgi:glucose/arabinose dehydrogenase
MYVSNGDAADHWRAQIPTSLRGKLLRFQPDGWVPASNPIPGSPVYALGIRHVQGIGWHPGAGRLLVVDHGPTGLPTEDYRTDHDELNAVSPGANLGWPIVAGGSEGGGLTSPILTWTPALAPAGLAVYSGGHPEWEGSAFVTGLRGTSLRRIVLESVTATAGEAAQGTGAAAGAALDIRARCEETLLRTDFGRLRLVREAPDGSVWVGTSNRDGRGLPREGDDRLLRIRPPGR